MPPRPKVEVELPEGIDSKESLDKLFATFMKQRVSGKSRDKAIRTATKTLITNHKPEYDKLVATNMPK